jgi:FixJ family two-component response regulator
MSMDNKFAFISTALNRSFAEVLANVLLPYGPLELRTWQETPDLCAYTLLFLDAGVLADVDPLNSLKDLLMELFQRCPGANVVVTTTSPTWKRSREALKAGAVDYIRQTLDPDRLSNDLNPTLKKYLPESLGDEG